MQAEEKKVAQGIPPSTRSRETDEDFSGDDPDHGFDEEEDSVPETEKVDKLDSSDAKVNAAKAAAALDVKRKKSAQKKEGIRRGREWRNIALFIHGVDGLHQAQDDGVSPAAAWVRTTQYALILIKSLMVSEAERYKIPQVDVDRLSFAIQRLEATAKSAAVAIRTSSARAAGGAVVPDSCVEQKVPV